MRRDAAQALPPSPSSDTSLLLEIFCDEASLAAIQETHQTAFEALEAWRKHVLDNGTAALEAPFDSDVTKESIALDEAAQAALQEFEETFADRSIDSVRKLVRMISSFLELTDEIEAQIVLSPQSLLRSHPNRRQQTPSPRSILDPFLALVGPDMEMASRKKLYLLTHAPYLSTSNTKSTLAFHQLAPEYRAEAESFIDEVWPSS